MSKTTTLSSKTTTLSFALAGLAVFFSSAAWAEIIVPVSLKRATLFMNNAGAELRSEGQVNLPAGESELRVTGIADQIDSRTLMLNLNPNISILTLQVQDSYIVDKPKSALVQGYEAAREKLQNELNEHSVKHKVLEEEVKIIQGNGLNLPALAMPNGVSEQEAILTFVSQRLTANYTQQMLLVEASRKLKEKIDKLNQQISAQKADASAMPTKEIVVRLYSADATSSPVGVTYTVANAGWQPLYDITVNDLKSPLMLTYKAELSQVSGLDWRDIDLTLLTSNPNESITAPELHPWVIDLYKPLQYAETAMQKSEVMSDSMAMPQMSPAGRAPRPYVTRDQTGINTKFDVRLPFTLESGNSNTITLKQTSVSAAYRYIAVPKMSDNAFLQAQVSTPEALLLIPGMASVYLNGNFSGQTYLDARNIDDANMLSLSLGTDKSITVKRDRNRHVTSKPAFLGNTVTQEFSYVIDVKNNRDEAITIVVDDQLPVVANEAISLANLSYAPATYDQEKGRLEWTLSLAPNEAKTLPFSFAVKYQKDQKITGL